MTTSGRATARKAGVGAAIVAALLATVVVGLALGFERRDAFWLDESWTGGIIGQPTWRATFQQIYWDVNAPLYYLLLKLWSGLFGLSDWALRAPSLAAAAAVPLLAILVPAPGLTRGQRLAWGATLAFWFPTLCYAAEARCYALLLLTCTAQTLAFMRLMQAPDQARASVWAALAALSILVHYDALYLGAAQGVLYVARQPRRALATWPAALAFAPTFGWMAFHWPRIAEFARPDIAWYSPLRPSELPLIGGYVADGGDLMPKWLAALAASALALRFLPFPERPSTPTPIAPVLWSVGAAVLAAAVMVAIGFFRPSFTFRYLTPCEPGLLLGVVVLAQALAGRRAAPVTLALLACLYLGVSGWMLGHGLRMAPRRYNFEAASAALAREGPQHLVFLWDHPVDPILHPEQLAALGGFFLHRSGQATQVEPVILKGGEDPNGRLAAEAARRGTAILWLYDRVVHGTAANRFPPALGGGEPGGLRCRDFGSARFGVLACQRR
jgi:hypothetical protein